MKSEPRRRALFFPKILLASILCFTLSACATTTEALLAYSEPPSVEMVLERINTAARAVELESIILNSMPISSASSWPHNISERIPRKKRSALMSIVAHEAIFSLGSPYRPSPIKMKLLYVQALLFSSYPDAYYRRGYMEGDLSPEEVNARIKRFGNEILGSVYPDGYPDIFDKSFYRFLLLNPGFKPAKEHFVGTFKGKNVEFYPNITEAVISLAENGEELTAISRDLWKLEDKKARMMRDIAEIAGRVGKLTAEEKSGNANHSQEINELEKEREVASAAYRSAAMEYREKLDIWKIELANIKTQTTAFDNEQAALAGNIQKAVDSAQSHLTQASALIAIAMIKLPVSIMNVRKEVRRIARSPLPSLRIVRIWAGLASLSGNVAVIKNELGLMKAQATALDNLFGARIKAVVPRDNQAEE